MVLVNNCASLDEHSARGCRGFRDGSWEAENSSFCLTKHSDASHCSKRFQGSLRGNARDLSSIPGLGRSPGERNGSPLQYSCLENPTDRGAWQATVHGVTRVRHDLATKPPPPIYLIFVLCFLCTLLLLPYFRSLSLVTF